MTKTFRGNRLHIAILGRCNTGKSTVLNLLAGQTVSIVSPQPGTTGDPVSLPFELHPLGPVTFYDTAGLDECSNLGALRREAGRKTLARADMALVVTDEAGIGPLEKDILAALRQLETPTLVVLNKQDRHGESIRKTAAWCKTASLPCIALSADRETDPTPLREAVARIAPSQEKKEALVADILEQGAHVVCVAPLDGSAPAGRLIAPQVQVLRELLETGHPATIVQPAELARTMANFKEKPGLVIADSQAVREVAAILPEIIPLTTFSVIFARQKGDFTLLLNGALAIDALPAGAKILIAEACSHHAQNDDIARVKIPALLQKRLKRPLEFSFSAGRDFPDNLEAFDLAIHCGGCMLNPGEMRRRLRICAASGVPATNFGMAISVTQDLLERVAAPWRQA